MMVVLEVLACASGASVQDLGRSGYRRFGVAAAGAMDHYSLVRANLLVGNPPGAAALELALAGARLRVLGGAVSLAVAGPGAGLTLGNRCQAPYASAVARDGEEIRVSPGREGVYAYLAVAGGITTPVVLGSRAVHLRSGIGGRPLRPGDRLPCEDAEVRVPRRLPPEGARADLPLRIVLGPQADRFTPDVVTHFATAFWRVEPRFDRMALSLAGPPVPAVGGHDIVSDGVMPGSIQIPGNAQPLILLRDCQTTGGYPKIASVISADLDALAQCRPGTMLRFAVVTPEEACRAARERAERKRALEAETESEHATQDPRFLLSNNLIGGVTDGTD